MSKDKCPYCNKSFECGKIRVAKSEKLWWLPDNVSLPLFFPLDHKIVSKGGVVFRGDPLSVIQLYAKFCRDCNYIIVDGVENNANYKKIVKSKE